MYIYIYIHIHTHETKRGATWLTLLAVAAALTSAHIITYYI